MKPSARTLRVPLALCATLVAATLFPLVTPARADGPRVAAGATLLPAYRQECSGCHIAYPPSMLPRASWQRLMNDLPRHFGTDASLDPATLKQIGDWLQRQAADGLQPSRATASPPEDRITRSAWFQREHDEIPAATWQRPSIKSPANCAACHTRAEQGDFRERNIRIPR